MLTIGVFDRGQRNLWNRVHDEQPGSAFAAKPSALSSEVNFRRRRTFVEFLTVTTHAGSTSGAWQQRDTLTETRLFSVLSNTARMSVAITLPGERHAAALTCDAAARASRRLAEALVCLCSTRPARQTALAFLVSRHELRAAWLARQFRAGELMIMVVIDLTVRKPSEHSLHVPNADVRALPGLQHAVSCKPRQQRIGHRWMT